MLGSMTKADFQAKLVTGMEPDRKNPIEAVPPYVVAGTVSDTVPEGHYALRVMPTGEVTLHSRFLFNAEERTAIVPPGNEASTIQVLGTTAEGQDLFSLFPETDSTVAVKFPLIVLGASEPFLFFFHVKTEWQHVRDGLQGL